MNLSCPSNDHNQYSAMGLKVSTYIPTCHSIFLKTPKTPQSISIPPVPPLHSRTGTPSGRKVNLLCEELSLTYKVHKLDISKNVQKEDWFLAINPNVRIHTIVDQAWGKEKRVFESGAILLYLTERYNKEHRLSFEYDRMSIGRWLTGLCGCRARWGRCRGKLWGDRV